MCIEFIRIEPWAFNSCKWVKLMTYLNVPMLISGHPTVWTFIKFCKWRLRCQFSTLVSALYHIHTNRYLSHTHVTSTHTSYTCTNTHIHIHIYTHKLTCHMHTYTTHTLHAHTHTHMDMVTHTVHGQRQTKLQQIFNIFGCKCILVAFINLIQHFMCNLFVMRTSKPIYIT